MITEVFKAVSSGLYRVKPCTIYRDKVPQNFKIPCFLVMEVEENPSPGINKCLNNMVQLDVLYFPGTDPPGNEFREIEDGLRRGFEATGYRTQRKRIQVEHAENVLHFYFAIKYREYLDGQYEKMRTLRIEEGIKEE